MSTSVLVFILLAGAFLQSASADSSYSDTPDIPYHAHIKILSATDVSTTYRVSVHFLRHWVKDAVMKLEATGDIEIVKGANEWTDKPCKPSVDWRQCVLISVPDDWRLLQPDPMNSNPRWIFDVTVYKTESGKGSDTTSLTARFMAKHSEVHATPAPYTQTFPPTLNLTTVATSMRLVGDVVYGTYQIQMVNCGKTPIVAAYFSLPKNSVDAQALTEGTLNGLRQVKPPSKSLLSVEVVNDFFLAPGKTSTGLEIGYEIPMDQSAVFQTATLTRYA